LAAVRLYHGREPLADFLAGAVRKRRPAQETGSGGWLWQGEAEAREALNEVVEAADRHGRLRSIIEAVTENRVEDDFSPRWSYEREDFERKLYHKRLKIKVSFVELDETIPVHGPDSELDENLLWEDFLTLLNRKERSITVCLRNGFTKAGEISTILGYASHSPVSVEGVEEDTGEGWKIFRAQLIIPNSRSNASLAAKHVLSPQQRKRVGR
jgi:hypothetical protein